MKPAKKKAPRPALRPPPKKQPVSVYADLLTADELDRFASRASLVDEVLLLRAHVYRLGKTIDFDDTAGALKQVHGLVEIVRIIATIERLRLLISDAQARLGPDLPHAVGQLGPGRFT